MFRYALSEHLHRCIGEPRRCREPFCRRTRRCAGPDMRCARDFPAPPVKPEEQRVAKLAEFLRALQRRAAEAGLR